MKIHSLPALLIVLSLALNACAFQPRTTIVTPNLINVDGSAILLDLGLAWSEHFMHENKDVTIVTQSNGNEAGFAALTDSTANLVAATRLMTDTEMDAALANGIHPIETLVARQAIAIIVNAQNPVSELTVGQVADIYRGKINNWNEVGGRDAPITRFAPAPKAGARAFFVDAVLHDSATASAHADAIDRYIFWILHGEGQSTAQHHGFVPILALRATRTHAP